MPILRNKSWALFQYNTSSRKISWSLEATRLAVPIIGSFWHLTGASATRLPTCLSNFRAIVQFEAPILRLEAFVRSYNKTSCQILKQGPINELEYFANCNIPYEYCYNMYLNITSYYYIIDKLTWYTVWLTHCFLGELMHTLLVWEHLCNWHCVGIRTEDTDIVLGYQRQQR